MLRAVDVLDGIEAYGLSLRKVKNASVLSGTVLVAMHLMVGVFILSAAVQAVRRREASAKGAATVLRSFLGALAKGGHTLR